MRNSALGVVWWAGLVGCSPEVREEGGRLRWVDPPVLADTDPTAGQFAATLRAAPVTLDITGEPVEFLAYNGTIPGPLVRVPLGEQIHIRFENGLSGGHAWASGIHWHGIEGYNAADGTPLTQPATVPGEGFDYRFEATRAGVFWYHPHVRGAQALFSGLYGPLIVEDPDEAELISRGILPAEDRVVVLSDTWTAQGVVTSAEVDDPMEIMNGTEGRELLVNGQVQPTLEVVAGSAVRLRVVNASITRFWRLSVPGQVLYRVGGEGGLLDAVRVEGGGQPGERFSLETGAELGSEVVDSWLLWGEILLAPGERADVVLVADGGEGEVWPLRWEDVPRGRHEMWMEGEELVMGTAADDGLRAGVDVAFFRLIAGEPEPFSIAEGDPLLQAVGRATMLLDDTDATEWLGEAGTTLDEEMGHTTGEDGRIEMTTWLGMNGEAWHPDHMAGPAQPEAPSARHARLGETLRWEVRNNSEMAHPFHLHGFSYQVEEQIRWPSPEAAPGSAAIRVPATHTEFEDTTLIPPHSSLFLRVMLADVSGSGQAAGRWVQHCHILQHGENGMMSELIVTP